jgi:hypothetical protein
VDELVETKTIHMEFEADGTGVPSCSVIVISTIHGPHDSVARMESKFETTDDIMLSDVVDTLKNLLVADIAGFLKSAVDS